MKFLAGLDDTLGDAVSIDHSYGSAYPDQFVDFIDSDGGDLLFEDQGGLGRVVTFAGPNGIYRTIYSTIWFGALKDAGATNGKAGIMAGYLRYLRGDALVVAVRDEISVSGGSEVKLLLEADTSAAGRAYAVLGSVSGTSPGIPAGSVTIPLKYDKFFDIVRNNLNSACFRNFQGQLDSAGRALATLNVPSPVNPALAGRTAHFAFVLLKPIDYASNAAAVQIVP